MKKPNTKKTVKKVVKKAAVKPAKKQVKEKALRAEQVAALKKILSEKRDDLMEMVLRKKNRDLPEAEIGDEIDNAVQTVEKEMLFELTNNEKMMLDTIENALRKVDKGAFGFCENCSKKISFERLMAMPWARYCMKCQSSSETA